MTWQEVALLHPEFVAWAVQAEGPLPDGEVLREDYERLREAYESRGEAYNARTREDHAVQRVPVAQDQRPGLPGRRHAAALLLRVGNGRERDALP